MSTPGWRRLYDGLERMVTPAVDQAVRSDELAQVAATVKNLSKGVRKRVDGLAARGWHAVNLPAGTDVQRLRRQVGALDREVRLLSLELERARQQGRKGRKGRKGVSHGDGSVPDDHA
jgi:hypothetical protein